MTVKLVNEAATLRELGSLAEGSQVLPPAVAVSRMVAWAWERIKYTEYADEMVAVWEIVGLAAVLSTMREAP